MTVRFSEDAFGFTWGPVSIERLFSDPKGVDRPNVFLLLKTDREELQIKVTPTGFIRVFNVKKRER